MVHCQACGITTTARVYGITFHRFPKNETQRNAWIDFVKKEKGSRKTFKCTTLCSQHFEQSCFDKTSQMKVRLKPVAIPTKHISRSKYEKISKTVAAMTVLLQTESDETSLVDTMAIETSTDATVINDVDAYGIAEKSTKNDIVQINTSQLVEECIDMQSQLCNRNINIESLPSTSLETDVSLKILPSDTPKEVVLKNRIASLGRSLADKSTVVRNLQKKIWKQQKQIFKLKSVIQELGKKNLISSDNMYTMMYEFGPNERLINRKSI